MDIEELAEKTYRVEVFDERVGTLFAIYIITEGNGVESADPESVVSCIVSVPEFAAVCSISMFDG